jgi:hypothetical protein
MRIDASAKHTAATRAEMSCSGSEKAGRRTSLSPRRHDTAVLAAMSWILSPRPSIMPTCSIEPPRSWGERCAGRRATGSGDRRISEPDDEAEGHGTDGQPDRELRHQGT